MRVLLLSTYELGHQPLGLARPAADLLLAGHEVRCLDLAVDPLDEALVRAVMDVSGRPYLSYHVEIPKWQMLGDYDVFLTPEFFRALVLNAGLTAHLDLVRGDNPHHIVEATFKAFARALDAATSLDPRVAGVPSTKGAL